MPTRDRYIPTGRKVGRPSRGDPRLSRIVRGLCHSCRNRRLPDKTRCADCIAAIRKPAAQDETP